MPKRKNNPIIQPMPDEGFVRLPQVLHVLGIGKTTFWNGIKTGRYPAPVKLGPRTSAWRVQDIRVLIAQLSSQQDNRALGQKGE